MSDGRGLTEAQVVAAEKITSAGPGEWCFVHHPDGFLIEVGERGRADQIAAELNAGRAALAERGGSE